MRTGIDWTERSFRNRDRTLWVEDTVPTAQAAAEALAEGGVILELCETVGGDWEFGLPAGLLGIEVGREGDGAGAIADFGEAFDRLRASKRARRLRGAVVRFSAAFLHRMSGDRCFDSSAGRRAYSTVDIAEPWQDQHLPDHSTKSRTNRRCPRTAPCAQQV
jgi:hypothetical protein